MLLTVIQMGRELQMTEEETIDRLTAEMSKQERYKWRKKIRALLVSSSSSRCPFTGNFIDEMGL